MRCRRARPRADPPHRSRRRRSPRTGAPRRPGRRGGTPASRPAPRMRGTVGRHQDVGVVGRPALSEPGVGGQGVLHRLQLPAAVEPGQQLGRGRPAAPGAGGPSGGWGGPPGRGRRRRWRRPGRTGCPRPRRPRPPAAPRRRRPWSRSGGGRRRCRGWRGRAGQSISARSDSAATCQTSTFSDPSSPSKRPPRSARPSAMRLEPRAEPGGAIPEQPRPGRSGPGSRASAPAGPPWARAGSARGDAPRSAPTAAPGPDPAARGGAAAAPSGVDELVGHQVEARPLVPDQDAELEPAAEVGRRPGVDVALPGDVVRVRPGRSRCAPRCAGRARTAPPAGPG